MNEREYFKLKQQIQAEYAEKLRALDLIWKMSQQATHRNGGAVGIRRGQLLKSVRDVLALMPSEFSVGDIANLLRERNPDLQPKRSSLSTLLKRLAKAGELGVVQVGRGKRGTTYRRA